MHYFRRIAGFVGLLAFFVAGPVMAAAPTLSSGIQLDTTNPYTTAQNLPNVFANKAVYGKLQGTIPYDLYKFTAAQSGEQTFTILLPKNQPSTAQLAAVFVDQTGATEGSDLGLPTPSDSYHTAVINQLSGSSTFTDRVLLQKYKVVGQQRIALQKGDTYYIWILDPERQATRYVIQLGTGQPWTIKDFFTSFGSWVRIETDSFAGTSPFHFSENQVGFTILLLGLLILVGIFLIQQIFALSSNRQKSAGFLLIKLQPFARVLTWIGLWLLLIGGYIFFNLVGWIGIPFVLVLLFLALLVTTLYETLSLSPKVSVLEVTKDEAVLPLAIRKRWYFTGFIELVLYVVIILLLGMFLAAYFVK